MADIPSFKLSKNPILQGLLILAIFLSGYFLYLLTGYGFGVDHNEIEIFFNGLKKYAGQGSPIKLTQAYVDSDALSKGTKIVTKTITQGKQIDALRMEVRRITTVLLRR